MLPPPLDSRLKMMMPASQLYNYSFELPFEATFDAGEWTRWFDTYWFHSITLSIIYMAAIWTGRTAMRNRPAFGLTKPLIYWNFAAALFSLVGAIRMTPEFFYVLRNYGFGYSVCTSGYTQLKVAGFWATTFTLSKAIELIDTAFIVLRKRPVIFLHWYHHVTVLLLTWYGYSDHTAPARWFIWMNYTIHAIMYTYYGLRAMSIRTPKWISASITSMQIGQMVVGCYIAYHVYDAKANGSFCQQTHKHLRFTIFIYFTYLVLFLHFFYQAYLSKGKQRASARFDRATNNGIANGESKKLKDS